jgi:hypothetical protein
MSNSEKIIQNRRIWDETLRESIDYSTNMKSMVLPIIRKDIVITNAVPIKKQTIMVLNESLLDVAKIVSEKKMNPLVVVTGNNNDPIKIVEQGAIGMESDLLRRSNLCMILTSDKNYPLKDNEVLYSPGVVVFKNSKYVSCRTFKINVLSVVPIISPTLITIRSDGISTEDYNSTAEKEKMQARINCMFEIALLKGHRAIVVNDFGVSHGNPINSIIDMFNTATAKYPVEYVFICIDHQQSVGGNSKSYIMFNKAIRR